MLDLDTEVVSEGHLADCLCDSVCLCGVRGDHAACLDVLMEFIISSHDLGIIRKIIGIFFNFKYNDLISGLLEFRGDHVLRACNVNREGNQGRWDVDLFSALLIKGTGHTVLTADGRKSEAQLRIVGTEKCCERLAPSCRLAAHSAEVLLECEANLPVVAACCRDLSDRCEDCIDRAVIRTPAGKIRIKAVAHHGHSVALSFQNRKLSDHGLDLSLLIFSAVRHHNGRCADGGVEHLHETFLGADI